MKITLIYDNEVYQKGLPKDWGFSCLVELNGFPPILFDTGANGKILLHNMECLGISPLSIGEVFLSHSHWDHTGGLTALLEQNPKVTVYLPPDFDPPDLAEKVVTHKKSGLLYDGIYTTGWLKNIEQSLILKTERGLAVIAGCSHSGVTEILDTASQFGSVYALIGGLHGFREFAVIKDLAMVCACHCTQCQSEIKDLYPQKWVDGGAGRIITL